MKLTILILLVLAALAAAVAGRSEAKPHPARIVADGGAVLIARCPAGYRKSTITARCVRNGVRMPSFGWF